MHGRVVGLNRFIEFAALYRDSVFSSLKLRLQFLVREQLGGYMGQTYTADVVLGTDQSRAVPIDPAELLAE